MKKQSTVINTSLFIIIGLFISLSISTAFAGEPALRCETTFSEKVLTIENNTIAFQEPHRTGRSISSVFNARTHKTQTGFNKTLYINGLKHKVHVQDLNNPNELNDFMAITSPKGHKMTYPINCEIL